MRTLGSLERQPLFLSGFGHPRRTLVRARSSLETTMLESIQQHIEAVLGAPELHAETLCTLFRISRTRLYRLFEPLGGVAK